MTDSATVRKWLQSVFYDSHNVRTHALSELLIRRRLDILRELVIQEELDIRVQQVSSAENLADGLTRVPRKWTMQPMIASIGTISEDMLTKIQELHNVGHFGMARTTELVREKIGWNKRLKKLVRRVVEHCDECAQICPTASPIPKGNLSNSKTWDRVSSDFTHVGSSLFLTLIDNASKFCVWRKLQNGSSSEVIKHLQMIFSGIGPPDTFFSDNGTVFCSGEIRNFMQI